MSGSMLITGGAGYIGSHVGCRLVELGYERVVVLDNLSTGFARSVFFAPLVVGDVCDQKLVDQLLREHEVDTVLHFAASIVVPESVRDPLKYYANNTCATRALLQSCARYGVKYFIFSSTAAVYGVPDRVPMDEESPTVPISPYGTSKLISEWMLRDLCRAVGMRHVILRYFNAAGCDRRVRIGQSTPNTNFIIKSACEAALGRRDGFSIFGTDYPTRDGTGVRDYIHIDDLAAAHVSALDYLRAGGVSTVLNCGYGHGYTVREVLDAVKRVTGARLHIAEGPRRPGDPPSLIADATKIKRVLGWQPKHDNLDTIVRSAYAWEKALAEADSASRARIAQGYAS